MTDYKILIHIQTPDNPDLAESVVKRIWELAEPYPARRMKFTKWKSYRCRRQERS